MSSVKKPDLSPKEMAAKKIAAIASALLWALGFFLAFVIQPGSSFIWLPDILLLSGFFPLLFIWQPAWPWLVFGICNCFVGFVLEISRFLPDSGLPAAFLPVRAHLAAYHEPLAWIFAGLISIVYGIVRLLKFCLYLAFKKNR